MKKPHLLFVLLVLGSYAAQGQPSQTSLLYQYVSGKKQAIKSTEKVSLFTAISSGSTPELRKVLSAEQFLLLNKEKSRSLFRNKTFSITLTVPYRGRQYELALIKEDINIDGVPTGKLTGNNKREATGKATALHYRGYIINDAASLASFSIFENGDIMGLFSNAEGNFNLGKMAAGDYILYNSEHMVSAPGYECGTGETLVTGENHNRPADQPLGNSLVLCNKLRLYWEVDYSLYNHNFSNNYTSTINYLTGLFNQVATLFYNEGIVAELSTLDVWTTPDTFTTTSSATGLNAIKNKWNSLGNTFTGDLCMLIDGGTTNNGGRAYVLGGSICNRSFAYGYSNVRGTYNTVPAYSWDVEVVIHETGHNLGSRHTQWCGWNTGAGGTCGAIDDCVTVETNTACSTCTATTITNPTPPAGFKGTIMSYCHLRSGIGINLANGFGPLPGDRIRSNMNSSSFCTVQNNVWTGMVSSAWETPGNWSCNSVPTENTDVTIQGAVPNNPVISSVAACRKLRQTTNAAVTVNQGFSLRVAGTGQ